MLSCSKSGYYDWVNLGRPKYKAFNESYSQLVLDTYTKNNTWGIRSVRMKIKEFYGISLKNSTIQRYMKINNIKSITRKRTHRYSKYLKQNLQKEEIEEVVKNFIMYYNNERLQEKIQELAPMQFRKQALASLSF